MVSLWSVFWILLVVDQGVDADIKDPNDPKELLQTKWSAVASILKNKDIEQEAKEKAIDKIVSPIFDFPLMAKLVLGRKNWPKLNSPQREKFTQLFTQRLKTSYREKIALYRDEKGLFKTPEKKKNSLYIPMDLIFKDKNISILYKLHEVEERRKIKVGEQWKIKVDKHWKVYDVEIQGVSILLTYRSQFDDILRSGTVEDLLSRLEKPPAN